MSLGIIAADLDGLAIRVDGLVHPALFGQRDAMVVISLGVIRLESNRLGQSGGGLIELALIPQHHAQVVIRIGKVRLQHDGLAKGGDRLGQSPLHFQTVAALPAAGRFVQLLFLPNRIAKIAERFGIVWIQGDPRRYASVASSNRLFLSAQLPRLL